MFDEISGYDSWKTRGPSEDGAPEGTFARIEIRRGELTGEACAWFSPAGTMWKVEASVWPDVDGADAIPVELTGVEVRDLEAAQIEDHETDYSERADAHDRGDL